jgi:hypothetical protein
MLPKTAKITRWQDVFQAWPAGLRRFRSGPNFAARTATHDALAAAWSQANFLGIFSCLFMLIDAVLADMRKTYCRKCPTLC